MTTLQVTVINPKAIKLLRNLAEMNLIEIEKKKSIRSQLRILSQSLEKHQAAHGNPEPLSMEEIVAEVKQMRAEQYATRKSLK